MYDFLLNISQNPVCPSLGLIEHIWKPNDLSSFAHENWWFGVSESIHGYPQYHGTHLWGPENHRACGSAWNRAARSWSHLRKSSWFVSPKVNFLIFIWHPNGHVDSTMLNHVEPLNLKLWPWRSKRHQLALFKWTTRIAKARTFIFFNGELTPSTSGLQLLCRRKKGTWKTGWTETERVWTCLKLQPPTSCALVMVKNGCQNWSDMTWPSPWSQTPVLTMT